MNELVNFARQALGHRSTQDGNEHPSILSPSEEIHVPDWLSCWRDLAQVTNGLLPEDPRLNPVLDALAECDRSYKAADLPAFKRGAERVDKLMQFAPGATVRWEGTVNHRLLTLGPSMIEYIHHDQGRLWVWVCWRGTGRWISESIVTTIEGPR